MKIKIETWCDSGANSESKCESEFEIDSDEWAAMSEDEKEDYAKEHAFEKLEWGWQIKKVAAHD